VKEILLLMCHSWCYCVTRCYANSLYFYHMYLMKIYIIPFRMVKRYNCIVCSKRTRLKDPSVKRYLQNKLFITNIVNTDNICNTCMHKYYNADTCHNKPAKQTRPEQEDTDPDYIPPKVSRPSKPLASPPSVSLNIPGASNSHARCVVCKKSRPKTTCHFT
jgi:hypothetical protein